MSVQTSAERSDLRARLNVSRPHLARFLGVSEGTVVRWEKESHTEPEGLALLVLSALDEATQKVGISDVQWILTQSTYAHRMALSRLLTIVEGP